MCPTQGHYTWRAAQPAIEVPCSYAGEQMDGHQRPASLSSHPAVAREFVQEVGKQPKALTLKPEAGQLVAA